jgi:hypothetical protein
VNFRVVKTEPLVILYQVRMLDLPIQATKKWSLPLLAELPSIAILHKPKVGVISADSVAGQDRVHLTSIRPEPVPHTA